MSYETVSAAVLPWLWSYYGHVNITDITRTQSIIHLFRTRIISSLSSVGSDHGFLFVCPEALLHYQNHEGRGMKYSSFPP